MRGKVYVGLRGTEFNPVCMPHGHHSVRRPGAPRLLRRATEPGRQTGENAFAELPEKTASEYGLAAA